MLLRPCHGELASTRGAAITLARIDCAADMLRWMGVGNVTATWSPAPSGVESRSSARLLGGIVGYQMPERPRPEPIPIAPGDLLVVASDGIAEDHAATIDFAASAADIAERILDRHRRGTTTRWCWSARHRGSAVMDDAGLPRRYANALHAYLRERDEANLAAGHELGRLALQKQLSMLEIIEGHFRLVEEVPPRRSAITGCACTSCCRRSPRSTSPPADSSTAQGVTNCSALARRTSPTAMRSAPPW